MDELMTQVNEFKKEIKADAKQLQQEMEGPSIRHEGLPI
jgi:hypothetical protein